MSVANLSRLHDLAGCAPREASVRGVALEDVRYAEAKRAIGWGWQTIATIRGVNQLDLRRACGDPTLDPDLLPPKPAPVVKPRRRGFERAHPTETGHRISRADAERRRMAVLEAIHKGAGAPAEVAERLGLEVVMTRNIIGHLRDDGMVEGDARSGWLHLTDAGRVRLGVQDHG